ncbi:hydrogenase maturation nickel metallochaperone HypA [Methylomonas paludis]|uniref:Hydrogenase maturation factor HypA n=1 Tax=Methylomonas paludis TaxID=1173101 RepID=A0A975RAJ3_9GAMM|nr:hydrogenase maturation nickel metallochaperone HypA [Methylomonas paludis]QWF72212.1 hydrogenase maturation nickel metallochaperone HypA [Methylomonas paludis]
MHEISLCENVLLALEQQALAQQFSKVNRICLEIGVLAAVDIEAFRFGFAAVMRGSLAEQAVLEISELPARGRCLNCGVESVIQQRYDVCPQCGAAPLQISSGEQMRIKELEVE